MKCPKALLILLASISGWQLLASATVAQNQSGNPVYDQIVLRGAPIGAGGALRRVRPPTLPDGLNGQQQQQAIEAVIQGKPYDYQGFLQSNIRAPHVLVIDDLQYSGGNAPGHSVDLWFVVHGKLSCIADPNFLKAQFRQNNNNRIDVLKANELRARNIELANIAGVQEYYAHGEFTIFPNNAVIFVRGTARATETLTDSAGRLLDPKKLDNLSSALMAAILDPRFTNDQKYPNQWRPILKPAAGGGGNAPVNLGNPTAYNEAAGYVKITQLLPPAPADALLVEYHLVYDEPQAWFEGKNLLRSKLPQQAPDDVREFRRKVKELMEKPVAQGGCNPQGGPQQGGQPASEGDASKDAPPR